MAHDALTQEQHALWVKNGSSPLSLDLRVIEVRNALRDIGWNGKPYSELIGHDNLTKKSGKDTFLFLKEAQGIMSDGCISGVAYTALRLYHCGDDGLTNNSVDDLNAQEKFEINDDMTLSPEMMALELEKQIINGLKEHEIPDSNLMRM